LPVLADELDVELRRSAAVFVEIYADEARAPEYVMPSGRFQPDLTGPVSS
jgi:hypothetical protein